MSSIEPVEVASFAVLLLARVADLVSTYLASPRLLLEANPLVRRLGWPYAIATTLLSLVAFVHVGFAFSLTVASLYVAGANFGRAWLARTLGEEAYRELLIDAAGRRGVTGAWCLEASGAACLASIGGLFWLTAGPAGGWAVWGALGLIAAAFATLLLRSAYLVRLRRMRASATNATR